jgi:3-methyladenine DNA glycosylase AlkD
MKIKNSPTAAKIRTELKRLADPDKARLLSGYFKTGPGEYGEGDIFLGLTVPALRKVASRHVDTPLREIRSLLSSGVHEERFLALKILVSKYESGSAAERKLIYDFYMAHLRHINNWDLVDTSAPYIVGRHLEDKSRAILARLASSGNLWERRISILATFYFIRQNDFNDSITIAGKLIDDHEDLIRKAVGWMLREIGKRDIRVEKSFLNKHRKVMPRTMLRYAIERFPESERTKHLKR